MKIIRCNIFETNSSSTHTLVIPHTVNEDRYELYDSLDHDYQFGREAYRLVEDYDEKIAYVYYVLRNYKERYDLRCDDPGYGSSIKVTEEDLNEFKKKVNEAYNKVKELTKHEPYDSEPTPDDIFYIIDNEEEVGSFKYDPFTDREPDGVDPELIRIAHILPSYTDRMYSHSVYVDHTEDFGENGFISKMLNVDVEYLMKFLFNKDSYIVVSGDEYSGYFIKTIGFEYDYSEDEYPQYQVNENGEVCPDRSLFPDTDKGWDEWWEVQRKYPITKDHGGFYDKLEEYKKDHDVFLKGN